MTCWFCNAAEENPEKTYRIRMFGEVDAMAKASVTKVKYSIHRISVPRCAMCRAKHRGASFFAVIGSILAVTTLVLLLFAAFDVLNGFMPGLLTGLIAGMALGCFSIRLALHKGILSIAKARRIYPEVKELLDRGYKFGKAPKDGAIEVHEEKDEIPDEEKPADQ
ncbi:MAG: hypothetical protein ACYC5K_04765 [Saccharofermentanales bacterium]